MRGTFLQGAICQKIKQYYENIYLRMEITGDLCRVYDKLMLNGETNLTCILLCHNVINMLPW